MAIESTDVMAAAKAGNPKAIAALLNRSLSAKAITARVSIKNENLSIFLESGEMPAKEIIAPSIQKGINSLELTATKSVKLYGRRQGADMPDWQYQFQLDTYIEPVTDIVAVEVVQPKRTGIKTTQAKQHKANSTKSTLPIKLIAICASSGLSILLLSIGIWFGFTRSAQSKSLAEAQSLLKEVVPFSASTELEALKVEQAKLLTNQEKIEDAIIILKEAPNLPFGNVATVGKQLDISEKQLSLVQTKAKETEQAIATLERLLPIIEEVRDSFAALDSSLDVGMSYRDYGSQVRQVKVAIDKLARQPGASDYSSYKNLNAAFEQYDFAHDVWKYYIESDEDHSFFPASTEYGSILINNYGVTRQDIVGTDYIYLDEALTLVWSEASKHVKLAQEKL